MTEQTDDDQTRRALRLFTVLMRASQTVAAHARRDISRHGLTPSEFGVLELLLHKGPTPLGAVGQKILLTTGSVTHVIDTLEKKGLVRRVACPSDRRVLYADLTDQGRELIVRAFPEHAECLRNAMSGLSPEEQETLANLAKRLGLSARDMLSYSGGTCSPDNNQPGKEGRP